MIENFIHNLNIFEAIQAKVKEEPDDAVAKASAVQDALKELSAEELTLLIQQVSAEFNKKVRNQ